MAYTEQNQKTMNKLETIIQVLRINQHELKSCDVDLKSEFELNQRLFILMTS